MHYRSNIFATWLYYHIALCVPYTPQRYCLLQRCMLSSCSFIASCSVLCRIYFAAFAAAIILWISHRYCLPLQTAGALVRVISAFWSARIGRSWPGFMHGRQKPGWRRGMRSRHVFQADPRPPLNLIDKGQAELEDLHTLSTAGGRSVLAPEHQTFRLKGPGQRSH